MTLKAEIPISIEQKVHRVYHQHHHYHLHHILDHHHLHIHNRSVFRGAPIPSQPQPQQQTSQILASPQAPAAILNHSRQQDDNHNHNNSTSRQLQQLRYDNNHDNNHQELVHPTGLRPQDERTLTSLTTTTTFGTCAGLVTDKSSVGHHQLQHQHRDIRDTSNYSKQRSQIQFILISAFAYILSPIDLIPEAIFGIFGILDDIVFLLMCLFCVAIILLYPLFREVRRAIFDKLCLEQKHQQQCPAIVLDGNNKCDYNKSK